MVTSPETVETPDQWWAGGGGRSQSGGGCFYHSWHEGLCCLDLGGWWWILRGVSPGEGDRGVSALLLTRHIVVRYSRFGVSLGKNSWLFVTNLSGRDTLDKDRPCLSSGGQWIVIMIMSAANTDTDILPESLPESGLIVFRAATYHEKWGCQLTRHLTRTFGEFIYSS